MPRIVRNFWVEAQNRNDGAGRQIATGPRTKEGSMTIILYQRNEGSVDTALTIETYALSDGLLRTIVFDAKHEPIYTYDTVR